MVVVALIFIKPEELPQLFRKIGRLYAKGNKAYGKVVGEIEKISNVHETIAKSHSYPKRKSHSYPKRETKQKQVNASKEQKGNEVKGKSKKQQNKKTSTPASNAPRNDALMQAIAPSKNSGRLRGKISSRPLASKKIRPKNKALEKKQLSDSKKPSSHKKPSSNKKQSPKKKALKKAMIRA